MSEYPEKMFEFRRVEEGDCDLLFSWANDPDTRRNSFSTKVISQDDHNEWFSDTMERKDVELFIFVVDGKNVGMMRLDFFDSDGNSVSYNDGAVSAEVSYSIALKYRGRGYGTKLINETEKMIISDYANIQKIIAKVKENNTGSQKIFERNGFDVKYIFYEKGINNAFSATRGGDSDYLNRTAKIEFICSFARHLFFDRRSA